MPEDRTLEYLYTLDPALMPIAYEFIVTLRENGVDAILTSGRRSSAEQYALIRAGRTTATKSKHLTGRAFDFSVYGYTWSTLPKWFWDAVGPFGESLGLTWGGRWVNPYDPGHFQLPW